MFSAAHFGQLRDSGLPHAAQNFLLVVLSVPHFAQRIDAPPTNQAPDRFVSRNLRYGPAGYGGRDATRSNGSANATTAYAAP